MVYHVILGSALGGHANHLARRGDTDGVDRGSVTGERGEETSEWVNMYNLIAKPILDYRKCTSDVTGSPFTVYRNSKCSSVFEDTVFEQRFSSSCFTYPIVGFVFIRFLRCRTYSMGWVMSSEDGGV